MLQLTDLIKEQIKTLAVMFSAGILIETLWQIKTYGQHSVLIYRNDHKRRVEVIRIVIETVFWISAAIILPAFLYYCAFGKVSLYAAAGFLAGLLLWKKICCGIIK